MRSKFRFKLQGTIKTLIVLGLIFIGTFSCSKQITLDLVVRGTKDLNNGGNSVVVWIFQLSADNEFMRATVESYKKQGNDLFINTLTKSPKEIVLHPEDIKTPVLNISEETEFIGILADFRNPDRQGWRQLFEIDKNPPKKLKVTIGFNKVFIENL